MIDPGCYCTPFEEREITFSSGRMGWPLPMEVRRWKKAGLRVGHVLGEKKGASRLERKEGAPEGRKDPHRSVSAKGSYYST